ncbi:MAG: cation:proton antiporter [Leptospirales bacterium]|nr:cation:proton antiporter [Leptospirales bacterium]
MHSRSLILYGLLAAGAIVLAFVLLYAGNSAFPSSAIVGAGQGDSSNALSDLSLQWIRSPLAALLMQIVVVVSVASIGGALCRRIGQPAVIGEVLAGIALGPSALGLLWPAAREFLFAQPTLLPLELLSQIGLVLFLFVIGMELDISLLRKQAQAAVFVSHASIAAPFLLGIALALWLYPMQAPRGVSFLAFSLFIGISMSITAFPVLARILQERNLARQRLGAIVLTCAASDDVTAWSLLAIVVAVVRAGNAAAGAIVVALAGLFVFAIAFVARPIMQRLGALFASQERMRGAVLTLFLLAPFASAMVTQAIGVHALFGAFLAGVIMPAGGELRRMLSEKLSDVSVRLLLPLFFAFTGLRTELGLLEDASAWLTCGLITLTAVVGKLGGSAIAARLVGESWRDSAAIGILMNTRGLMELVVLNIGLELGVLSPSLFAMMIVMALATTVMTSPALALLNWLSPDAGATEVSSKSAPGGALLAFGRRDTAEAMFTLLHSLAWNEPVRGLHLLQAGDLSPADAQMYFAQTRAIVLENAARHGFSPQIEMRSGANLPEALVAQAEQQNARLVLLGGARSVFSDDLLAGPNREIIQRARQPVAVLAVRGLLPPRRVLLLRGDENDLRLLELFAAGAARSRIECVSAFAGPNRRSARRLPAQLRAIQEVEPGLIDDSYIAQFDLLALDSELFRKMAHSPSITTLIVHFPT